MSVSLGLLSASVKMCTLRYSVKNEQKIDCGGAYIKVLPKADQASFGGETPYSVMFGPDICGATRRTHVIFNYEPKDEVMHPVFSIPAI